MEQAPSQTTVIAPQTVVVPPQTVTPPQAVAFDGGNDVDVVASFRNLGYFVGKGWVNLVPPGPGELRHLVFETELGGVTAEFDLIEP